MANKNQALADHGWSRKDARTWGFAKIVDVLNSTQLGMIWLRLLPNNWKAVTNDPEDARQERLDRLNVFIKFGFFQGVFASLESTLRLILRAIDPDACAGGTAAFKNIYECLLKSNLSGGFQDDVDLLDVLRNVRNTIHNNGVYLHKSGNNASVTYMGTTYIFEYGKSAPYASWAHLLEYAEKAIELLNRVVNDPVVVAHAASINDPTA
ncbi:MAG: hypothetical protein HN348_35900 [Proteobacteria bacterium]|nr:hypothetical protein [Pseudomonadota bacterium]